MGSPFRRRCSISVCIFFHNAKALMAKGTGPYFYLPKMESHLEARLWNDVFHFAQENWECRAGLIRATVLIETILAAFEMDEILYELREHSAGLNCGRWDYIFSFIKKFRNRPDFVLPNRAQVTMDRAFPEIVREAADPDLPPARHSCHGWDGGADSDQERSGGERTGAREGTAGQAARSARRARWHVGGASRPGARGEGDFRRVHADAEPDWSAGHEYAGDGRGSAGRARRRNHGSRACAGTST